MEPTRSNVRDARAHVGFYSDIPFGGDVDSRLYDDLDHATNDDEMRMINTFIERFV